jgi:tetratricopeptide (TPR) repeat protein
MKRLIPLFLILVTAAIAGAQVRPPTPRPSQKATILQTLGTTDVSFSYSRPAVKGRPIWADAPATMASRAKGEATLDDQTKRQAGEPIVPWDHVWRAGANEATLFVTTDDILVNGQLLPAGRYSFHTIPAKDGNWTVIFNKDDGQWGSFSYDQSKDQLRVKAKGEMVPTSAELLTYYFDDVKDDSATAVLRWEKMQVTFNIQVKDVVAATLGHLKAYVAAGKADDPGPAFNAALYAKSVKRNDEANAWFDQALKLTDAQIAAKETMQNDARKATILANMGRQQDAIAVLDKAIATGKAAGSDTSQLEKRSADWKAGKF